MRDSCRVIQWVMQTRCVFNIILCTYILINVLITITNHIATRNSYQYPRARCLFSLQVPSSARKRHRRHFLDLNVLFSLHRCYLQYIVSGIDVTYLFSIRTRRVVSLQFLCPSQFTQTLPKRFRVRRHFDEGSCRYPRTLYHCVLATLTDLKRVLFPVHLMFGALSAVGAPVKVKLLH